MHRLTSHSRSYKPHMATVIEKRRADGRVYYYLVESARVGGTPRIVSQQYLGSAAEIAAKLAGAPVRSQHKRFGDLAAVWSVIERIGAVEVIDAVVPRRADAAATVGTYLALACANRIVAPCSKLGFARLVGHHRWAALGETSGRRVGSSPVLGGDGPAVRGRPPRDRDRVGSADRRRVRPGTVGSGPGHDELRHLYRLRQRQGADRPRSPPSCSACSCDPRPARTPGAAAVKGHGRVRAEVVAILAQRVRRAQPATLTRYGAAFSLRSSPSAYAGRSRPARTPRGPAQHRCDPRPARTPGAATTSAAT